MNHLFRLLHLRALVRRRSQTGLCILGIAMGVAVMVGVDLANNSALKSFELAVDGVRGRTTHQIVGDPGGIPESLVAQLKRTSGVIAAAPVIEFLARSPDFLDRTFQIFGVDIFSEEPFRPFIKTHSQEKQWDFHDEQVLVDFLTKPGAVFLSKEWLQKRALRIGDELVFQVNGRLHDLVIAGFFDPLLYQNTQSDQFVIMDIASAQKLGGRLGYVTTIDLILSESAENAVRLLLPEGVFLRQPKYQIQRVRELLSSYRLNLNAMSLLAVFVGIFLIYNTMMFSIIQRRNQIGILRSLGVTSRQIRGNVILEAIVIGICGSVLGLVIGSLLTRVLIHSVNATIIDYYTYLEIGKIHFNVAPYGRALIIGILATLLAALLPAWEASHFTPRTVSTRSTLETMIRKLVIPFALSGIVIFAAAIICSILPTRSVLPGFAASFCIVLGSSLLMPGFIFLFIRISEPLIKVFFGMLGKMAGRNITGSISRTSVALAALMVSLSVAIGMAIMIHSFRTSVADWIDRAINSEFYITAKMQDGARFDAFLPHEAVTKIQSLPEVAAIDVYSESEVEYEGRPILIQAIDPHVLKMHSNFIFRTGDRDRNWDMVSAGQVVISESFATRFRASPGSTVKLQSRKGVIPFQVAAVFRSYSSDWGQVMMSRESYFRYWQDERVNSMGIYLRPGVDIRIFSDKLRNELREFVLKIYNHDELRRNVIEIFDRTFSVTIVVQFLAMIVAFVGILSALMALLLERTQELGLLRSLGMHLKQLRRILLIESGLIGFIATVAAVPTGVMLSLVLIYVINARSFGWSMQFHIPGGIFIKVLALALTASLLATIYPLLRLNKFSVATAMRSE